MASIDAWTAFFGWCTVVNVGVYIITVTALWLFRGLAYRINARIFALDEADVARIAFQYVGAYKLLITVFCFAPWLALKLMS